MPRKYVNASIISVIIFIVILYIAVTVYVAKTAMVDSKKHSDVILILGARAYIDRKYNPCLVSRVDYAVVLYKEHYASKLLFSGGYDKEDHRNEAQSMENIAVQAGVSPNNILLETRSASTYENFLFSQKILKSEHLHSVLIVTEPFHEPRAALIANKLGLNYTVSPAVYSPCWEHNTYFSQYFLKEPLAIILYKIENKL